MKKRILFTIILWGGLGLFATDSVKAENWYHCPKDADWDCGGGCACHTTNDGKHWYCADKNAGKTIVWNYNKQTHLCGNKIKKCDCVWGCPPGCDECDFS